MTQLTRVLASLLLFLAVTAPAAAGCQPPWLWGFLLGAMGLGTALLVLLEIKARLSCSPASAPNADPVLTTPIFTTLTSSSVQPMAMAAAAVVLWAVLSYLLDRVQEHEAGRLPHVAWPGLAFALAFVGVFAAGCWWGVNGRRLRLVLRCIFVACILYAACGVLQRYELFPRQILGWEQIAERPSGTYTNANRYAVLLAVGWCCGAAWLAALLSVGRLAETHRERRKRWLWAALTLGGLAVISTGLAFTGSRLTVFALSVSVGVAAAVWFYRCHGAQAAQRSTSSALRKPALRVGLALGLLLAPPVLLSLALVSLSGHRMVMRVGQLLHPSSPDVMNRARSMTWGAHLLAEEPLRGIGLGAFEARFRAVQPLEIDGQWKQVHNDWLQLAAELGAPAAGLLALATLFWLRLWWQGLRPGRWRSGRLILLLAGMGVLVPCVASLADFPLREPANGVLFFMLLGVCTAALARRVPHPRMVSAAPAWTYFVGALVLSACVGSAVSALRTATAACATPWLGYLKVPAPKPSDRIDYERALDLDPGNTEYLYALARVHFELLMHSVAEKKLASGAALEATLRTLEARQPGDYRVPWIRAFALAEGGAIEQAVDELEHAVRRAPAYRTLRRQTLTARLYFLVPRYKPFTEDRRLQVGIVLAHMRLLLEVQPGWEDAFVEELHSAGVTPWEAVDLWPRENTALALNRARYWMELKSWFLARQELERVTEDSAWREALAGRLDIAEKKYDSAFNAWARALETSTHDLSAGLEAWLARQLEGLPAAAARHAAQKWPEQLSNSPPCSIALAHRLQKSGAAVDASTVLSRLAARRPTPEALRLWSEVAASLNDHYAAAAHAKRAWEISNRSPYWSRWLDTVDECLRMAQRDQGDPVLK